MYCGPIAVARLTGRKFRYPAVGVSYIAPAVERCVRCGLTIYPGASAIRRGGEDGVWASHADCNDPALCNWPNQRRTDA